MNAPMGEPHDARQQCVPLRSLAHLLARGLFGLM